MTSKRFPPHLTYSPQHCLKCYSSYYNDSLVQEHSQVIISKYLILFSTSFKILNLNGLLSSMSRSFNSEQAQNSQKQAIISSLKKELYELKDKEHQFIPLENEVAGVESNFDMLTEEKQRIQNQHRIKLDIGRKSIVELRAETDNLKMQIHKASVAMEEVLRDITGLKRSCESRDNQIATLLSANQQVLSKNEQLLEDNRAQLNKIKNYKDERNRMDQECQKHLKNLQQTIALLKNLQKQARTLEASNSKLQSILSVAEKDHSELMQEAKNREQIMINTHKKLDQLNLQIDALREKARRLEKDCIRSEQQYRSTAESLQNLVSRNKDQAKRIRSCENELRGLQNDLDKAVLERDGLENDHQHLTSENDILNEEISKIMQQISECENINIQLNQQMQNHMDIDEQARKLLDRRENMLTLVETTTRRLLATAENIAHLR